MSDKNPESQKSKETARRRVLKRLVAGGGVVATGKIMPDDWHRPVVESVILPAHAQTSEQPPLFNNVNATVTFSTFSTRKT